MNANYSEEMVVHESCIFFDFSILRYTITAHCWWTTVQRLHNVTVTLPAAEEDAHSSSSKESACLVVCLSYSENLFWLVIRSHRHWLYDTSLWSLWSYHDPDVTLKITCRDEGYRTCIGNTKWPVYSLRLLVNEFLSLCVKWFYHLYLFFSPTFETVCCNVSWCPNDVWPKHARGHAGDLN